MALDPRNIARKGALAYIGAIAMTGDQVTKTFDRLARRGAQVEQAARKQVARATRSLRGEVEDSVAEGEVQVVEATSAVENGRDRLLEALNLPTHADVLKLNFEVTRLSGEIDELRKKARRQKHEVTAEPLPGYEKLNVEAVIDRLPALEEPNLLAVRAYEQEHGKRITVLRAVERALVARQAARGRLAEPATRTTVDPLPRYDELTAEEVVERLHGLDEAELLHVKVYEQEHRSRVTVVRAVEERLAARAEA